MKPEKLDKYGNPIVEKKIVIKKETEQEKRDREAAEVVAPLEGESDFETKKRVEEEKQIKKYK